MKGCSGRIHATKNPGVTLIEMLIVLSIMTIITAASIPSFLKFTNTARLRAAARDICTSLRTARRYAITKRINYAVTIYCTGAKIEKTIGYYSTADTVELKKFPPNITASTDYQGGADTQTSRMFTFTPIGACTSTNRTIYAVDSVGNHYIPITVLTATGRVKICDIDEP